LVMKFTSHPIWPYTSFLVSDKLDSTDPRHQATLL
jgi:hypothetical protein